LIRRTSLGTRLPLPYSVRPKRSGRNSSYRQQEQHPIWHSCHRIDRMDYTSPAAAHSRATLITVVTIVFLTIAWLAVLARTWVRAVMIRNYGWDDAIMFLALVCSYSSATATIFLLTLCLCSSRIRYTLLSAWCSCHGALATHILLHRTLQPSQGLLRYVSLYLSLL
jgi:hypothetical protein